MKRIYINLTPIILVITFISFQSCKKRTSETKISAHNKSESHNMGQNCMSCHVSGGKGEGWFQVAGTVYDTLLSKTNPNTTVQLYSDSKATNLKYTVQVDALGNFYTTEKIDFGSGLYPVVVGKTISSHMSTPITSGQCNSCHGVSTSKIWTK
jgi:hypothetical protein